MPVTNYDAFFSEIIKDCVKVSLKDVLPYAFDNLAFNFLSSSVSLTGNSFNSFNDNYFSFTSGFSSNLLSCSSLLLYIYNWDNFYNNINLILKFLQKKTLKKFNFQN